MSSWYLREADGRRLWRDGEGELAEMAEDAPLVARLPDAARGELESVGMARSYTRGQLLIRQGDQADFVFLLDQGWVKIWRESPDTTSLLLALRGPGELLGEMAVLDGGVRSANVSALTGCRVRVIGAGFFAEVVERHRLERVLLPYMSRRIREGEDLRAELAALPARPRVARCLLRLATPVSVALAPDGATEILLDQNDVADAVGLTRSTVNQVLRELRNERVVTTRRSHIAVEDDVALRRIAGL